MHFSPGGVHTFSKTSECRPIGFPFLVHNRIIFKKERAGTTLGVDGCIIAQDDAEDLEDKLNIKCSVKSTSKN